MLLIDDADRLLVLTLEEKRAEFDTRGLEKNVGLVDTSNDQEVGHDVFTRDAEYPA